MPNIPFPSVPAYPGVPALTRPIQIAVARNVPLSIAIGTVENLLIQALQQAPRWGIFDAAGNQLGIDANSGNPIITALTSQITGITAPVLSTFAFEFRKETKISQFPIEGGSFASFNKVELPANPIVTLVMDGSESDRTNFLSAIDDACKSTALYSVVTPEVTYANYSLESYSYQRRATRGATLLMVEVVLEEIRQVSAAFSTATKPIVNPQNPAATPQTNSGMTQPATPDVSTLKSITNKISALAGVQ
jgi:hypothetical protein